MKQTLTISGMSCGHCVMAVRQALSELEDVSVLDVTIGTVTIDVPDRAVTEARIAAAIDEEGFKLESVSEEG